MNSTKIEIVLQLIREDKITFQEVIDILDHEEQLELLHRLEVELHWIAKAWLITREMRGEFNQ
jgi:hypothetical protein